MFLKICQNFRRRVGICYKLYCFDVDFFLDLNLKSFARFANNFCCSVDVSQKFYKSIDIFLSVKKHFIMSNELI